jgi:outer membrane protein assembly factor BamB
VQVNSVVILSILCILAAGPAHGTENWPQFRGPGARGVFEGESPPATWSTDQNVRWKWEDPGRGWSSPIVWGNRVFVTTCVSTGETEPPKPGLYFGGERPEPPADPHLWKVVCLDLESGSVVWDRVAHEGSPPTGRHVKNSYASETPVTDGEHVYAYFGNVGLFCYDMEGHLKWSRKFEPRKIVMEWGTAASPALHEDLLIICNDNLQESYLAAYDKHTGEELWRVDRDEQGNWATPYVWENELRTEIIVPGTEANRAYDLQGKLLYEFGGNSKITIATPYAADGLLYVSSGYVLDPKKPIFAIRPGASGDISLDSSESSNEYIVWVQKRAAPYNPSTLVYEGLLYVLYDNGVFACYDAQTGEEVYGKKRLRGGGSGFTASPWACDGKVFCASEGGETFVLRAGREFEILHTNELAEDDMIMASPAIAGGRLFLRTAARLYCIE